MKAMNKETKKVTEKYVYLQLSASLSQDLYPPTKINNMAMCMSLLLYGVHMLSIIYNKTGEIS